MNFGDKLNNYMKVLNCTSKDICNLSGLSPTLISRYLNYKRTPRVDSIYIDKIATSLEKIAQNKSIDLKKDDVIQSLNKSINFNYIDYDVFVNNFNTLQSTLNILTVDFAKALGYDASFLSRIKNKKRKPADMDAFIDILKKYIISCCQNSDKKAILASLFNCPISDLNDNGSIVNVFVKWITTSHLDNKQDVFNFLSVLDNFNLKDYINTDFDKVKVPTVPVIFKNSKVFYGMDGRKKAEGEFLKTTLLSKSQEPIFFYCNLPISEIAEDEDFNQKWILAMTMLLKKGLHLNIIHDIDRPINEMLLGLERWLPIYMSGSISPYYFKNPPSNLFCTSHYTSGSIALSGECMKHNQKVSKFYLTTKKEELEYEKEKSKYLLSKAKPLMEIFKENDRKKFDEFMKKYENKDVKIINKKDFKDIDFYVYANDWVIINKNISPEIHFVIYNSKLIKAIKAFLFDI